MYLFLTVNGCARCNAMEGYYEEEPARPHPHCRCEIGEEADLTGSSLHEYYYQWQSYDRTTYTATYEIFVVCCGDDNTVVQDVVDITFENDPDLPEFADETIEHMNSGLLAALDALAEDCPNPNCAFV
jgi:hypothetical protein